MSEIQVDDIAPQLIELLAWYGEAGVDSVLDETATDWRDRREAPGARAMARLRVGSSAATETRRVAQHDRHPGGPQAERGVAAGAVVVRPEDENGSSAAQSSIDRVASAPTVGERRFPAVAPDAAEADARRLAATAADLAALRGLLEHFDGCALKATAKSLCFYRGVARARLMIVGEAPGRDEDIAGKPFVGRAGMLLDKMLAAIGLGEDDVHITNVVYWRPPGNRTPTPQETAICRPFLERQIALVAPEFVLTLGGPAANSILGGDQGILRTRGRWQERELGGMLRRVMPSLHPAYLLRTPAQKRLAWRDLLMVRLALEGDSTDR